MLNSLSAKWSFVRMKQWSLLTSAQTTHTSPLINSTKWRSSVSADWHYSHCVFAASLSPAFSKCDFTAARQPNRRSNCQELSWDWFRFTYLESYWWSTRRRKNILPQQRINFILFLPRWSQNLQLSKSPGSFPCNPTNHLTAVINSKTPDRTVIILMVSMNLLMERKNSRQ